MLCSVCCVLHAFAFGSSVSGYACIVLPGKSSSVAFSFRLRLRRPVFVFEVWEWGLTFSLVFGLNPSYSTPDESSPLPLRT